MYLPQSYSLEELSMRKRYYMTIWNKEGGNRPLANLPDYELCL